MTQPVPHRIVAARMRELRQRHGWSAARLAAAMATTGHPWDRSLIANLESGRRRILTVSELLALGYVLSVAPVHLIVPPRGVDTFEVVPGVTVPAETARDWIRGYAPIGDPRIYATEMPDGDRATWMPYRHAG